MLKGWINLSGRIVYYGTDGKMVHGFTHVNDFLVHFAENNGDLTRNSYVYYNGQRYYARNDGAMSRA